MTISTVSVLKFYSTFWCKIEICHSRLICSNTNSIQFNYLTKIYKELFYLIGVAKIKKIKDATLMWIWVMGSLLHQEEV